MFNFNPFPPISILFFLFFFIIAIGKCFKGLGRDEKHDKQHRTSELISPPSSLLFTPSLSSHKLSSEVEKNSVEKYG